MLMTSFFSGILLQFVGQLSSSSSSSSLVAVQGDYAVVASIKTEETLLAQLTPLSTRAHSDSAVAAPARHRAADSTADNSVSW